MSQKRTVGAKIVVIGGGTGSFTVLSGLKQYASDITALVNMADDGGSTGVLRDEQGVLPPGDVRQCLVALSDSPKVRDLFNYRFDSGGLEGHAFGNLFLTALEKMTGSFAESVELASKVLNITGKVEPITLSNVTLCAEGKDGQPVHGESNISYGELAERPQVWLEPHAEANPLAIEAIESADIVVIAPGNLYGSLAPALVVDGVGEALCRTGAICVYVCNLVTKPGQTESFKVSDFADEIERLAGGTFLDYVIFNTDAPNQPLQEKYTREGEYGVEVDIDNLKTKHYQYRGAQLLAQAVKTQQAGDPLAHQRSFIRHDEDKVARQIMRIFFT